MNSEFRKTESQSGGDRVGRYQILSPIKPEHQGQGRVFHAVCVEAAEAMPVGTEVALKEMLVPFESDRQLSRAGKTVELLCKHPHPAIVQYYEFFISRPGTFHERQCVVQEFLRGRTLGERIEQVSGGLPWEEVAPIFSSCLDALQHATSLGITHRDIKPSNIFLTDPEDRAKLIDFEIARHEAETQSTTTGMHGSFDYMAPDFHLNFQPYKAFSGDEVSDIYSFSVCLFEALAGILSYGATKGDGAQGYFERFKDYRDIHAELSHRKWRPLAGMREFLAKGLAMRREDRFQTFEEMRLAFSAIQREVVHDGREAYQFIKWIGSGGFADVYHARRVSDGRDVALKCLRRNRYSDPFLKEARLLADCRSPYIVRTLGCFKLIGIEQYFIVLELLDGMPRATLRGRIRGARHKGEHGLPSEEVAAMFTRYALALDEMHGRHKIIHRDIKPSNLYAPEGDPDSAKILDLGVARDLEGTQSVGPVPGTFDYMAPEFGRNKKMRGSPESDIYSLGLCFYEALTGKPALKRLPAKLIAATYEAFYKRCKRPQVFDYSHPVFSQWPELRRILERALDFNPRRRYASGEAFARDLESVFEASSPATVPEDFSEKPATGASVGDRPTVAPGPSENRPEPEELTGGTRPTRGIETLRTNANSLRDASKTVWHTLGKPLRRAALWYWLAGGCLFAAIGLSAGYGYVSWRGIRLSRTSPANPERLASEIILAADWAETWNRFPLFASWFSTLESEIAAQRRNLTMHFQDEVERSLHKVETKIRDPEIQAALGSEAITSLVKAIEEMKTRSGYLRVSLPGRDSSGYPNLTVSVRQGEEKFFPTKTSEDYAWGAELIQGDYTVALSKEGYEVISNVVNVVYNKTNHFVIPPSHSAEWIKTDGLLTLERAERDVATGALDTQMLKTLNQIRAENTAYEERVSNVIQAHNRRVAKDEKEQNRLELEDKLASFDASEWLPLGTKLKRLAACIAVLKEHVGRIDQEKGLAKEVKARQEAVEQHVANVTKNSGVGRMEGLKDAMTALTEFGKTALGEERCLELVGKVEQTIEESDTRRELETKLALLDAAEEQSLQVKLKHLAACVAVLEKYAGRIDQEEGFAKKLIARQEAVEQHVEDVTNHSGDGRMEGLKDAMTALNKFGKPALGEERSDALVNRVREALETMTWRFVNASPMKLRVLAFGEEKEVEPGNRVRFQKFNQSTPITMNVRVHAVSPGYIPHDIQEQIDPGGVTNHRFEKQLAVRPVPVVIRGKDYSVWTEDHELPVTAGRFEATPGQDFAVRWRRKDYLPLETVRKVAIGDAPIEILPPKDNEWRPSSSLTNLREAEQVIREDNYFSARLRIPADPMNDPAHEARRLEIKKLLLAKERLDKEDMEAALEVIDEYLFTDAAQFSKQWNSLVAKSSRNVWKIGDPGRGTKGFAFQGPRAGKLREKTGVPREEEGTYCHYLITLRNPSYEPILTRLVRDARRSCPYDLALAVYCETVIRNNLRQKARLDTASKSVSLFVQIGEHAERVCRLWELAEQADRKTRAHTMRLIEGWSDTARKQTVLPVFQAPPAHGDGGEALYRRYANFSVEDLSKTFQEKGTRCLRSIRQVLQKFRLWRMSPDTIVNR